jgi:DNA-binding transcriptional LysR family regulator
MKPTCACPLRATGGGIAIGDSFLNMPLIRQGQLTVPIKIGLPSAQTYSLYVPLTPAQSKAARRFEDWLRSAVQAYQSTILDELAGLGIRIVPRAGPQDAPGGMI